MPLYLSSWLVAFTVGQGVLMSTCKSWAGGKRSYFQWVLVLFVADELAQAAGKLAGRVNWTLRGVCFVTSGRGGEGEARPIRPLPPFLTSCQFHFLYLSWENLEGAPGLLKVGLVSNVKHPSGLLT